MFLRQSGHISFIHPIANPSLSTSIHQDKFFLQLIQMLIYKIGWYVWNGKQDGLIVITRIVIQQIIKNLIGSFEYSSPADIFT